MPSTNGHGPKRAILYARVSTDEQARSGFSLAQQLEALRGYAARHGYEVLEEVVVSGFPGETVPILGQHHGDTAGGHKVPHPVHTGPLKARPALAGVGDFLENLEPFSGGVLS